MEKKEEKGKKRAGPTAYCCGSHQAASLCAKEDYGLAKNTDSVLVLGSGLDSVIKALSHVKAITWMKEDGSRRVIDQTKQIRKTGSTESLPSNVSVTYGDLHNLFEVASLGRFQLIFLDPNSFSGQKLLIYSLSLTETLAGLFPEARALVCISAILCDHVAVRFVNGPQLALEGKKKSKGDKTTVDEAQNPTGTKPEKEHTSQESNTKSTLACYASQGYVPPELLVLPKIMQKPGRVVGTFGVSQYRDVIPYVCLETDNVLEIGCQHGMTTLLIAKHCTRGQIFGVDIGKNSIERAFAVQEERRKKTHKVEVDGNLVEVSDFEGAPLISYSVGDGFDVEALAASFGPRARPDFDGVHVIFVDLGGLSSRHAALDLVTYTERLWASFAPTLRVIVVKSMAGLHLASKYRYVNGTERENRSNTK